jgi:acyl-coenzyme A synthetase/AMP-(fatty) acid ligase
LVFLALQVPIAFLVPKVGHAIDAEQVVAWLNERVAPYKRLRHGCQVVDKIPKSASGKILRRLLRDQDRQRLLEQKPLAL